MLLKDLQADNSRKMAKINKTLKEQFGFTLASEIDSSKLNKLYTKIADDLYNLKLDLSGMKDKAYVQKLLVAEGLKIMLDNKRKEIETLRESHLVGPGARRYEAALTAAAGDVEHACSIGDDYEEAIKDAMKDYRSSELRFPDEMFEYDLREMTVSCTLDSQISQYEGEPDFAMESPDQDTFSWGGNNFDSYNDPAGQKRFLFSGEYSFMQSPKVQQLFSHYGGKVVDTGDDALEVTLTLSDEEASVLGDRLEQMDTDGLYGGYIQLDIQLENRAGLKEDAGHSILDIITPEELDELRSYVNGDVDPANFISSPVYEKMFEYYMSSGEIPYGIAKGRTGDPDQWIIDRVVQDYGSEVMGVEEGADSPRGRAEHSAWRRELAQQKSGSVQDFFSSRAARDDRIKAKNEVPARRVKFGENKTTNRKENMKEGYVKQLRKLLEAEVEQAESLIAARGFSQELQDMVEKLGRLVNEDLPAVAEQMRDAYGADVATGFENTVSGTLNNIMDTLRDSKQEVDNSVSAIADGQTPSASSDMGDTDFGDEDELDLDLDGDTDLELPDMGDEGDLDLDSGDIDDLEGADDELLGRAKKESVDRKAQIKKQIVEMQQKLARIKAKRSK